MPATSAVSLFELNNTLQGGCLCGDVRYQLLGSSLSVCRCHCVSCRKASGSAGVVWAIVAKADFRLLGTAPREYMSSTGVTRSFCPRCSSSLTYATADQPDTIDVTVATLDHPELLAPTAECWLSDALPWEPIDPALAHFAQDTP
jgi:hypothetical protein